MIAESGEMVPWFLYFREQLPDSLRRKQPTLDKHLEVCLWNIA